MILKLKRTPGLYLVGFMASGKTTLGKMLADHIGWSFADLDKDIEQREQESIASIFDHRGEAEFRRLEHEAMKKRVRGIECGRPLVMALGGGAFVQPDNFALLENNGVTLWLDCPLDLIENRLRANGTERPLARDPQRMRQLFQERRAAYQLADFRIDACSDDPQVNLAAALALPIFH